MIEARLSIEAEKSLNAGDVIKGGLSGVIRRGLGDTETDVTVFSSTNSLIFTATDFTGASVSVGYEKHLASNAQFKAIAEQEIGDDAQRPYFRIGLNWSF